MSNRVRIFDTTLRDGEQSPGAAMTSAEKLEVARTLARLGVDIIEAGFPAAPPHDPPLAPAPYTSNRPPGDLRRRARRPRIHTFLATSDVHLEHKLRLTRAEALA